jgi:hypothetical protein
MSWTTSRPSAGIDHSRNGAMLNSVKKIDGCSVRATDGLVGHVEDVFFDDRRWAIRYIVVDTGRWLSDRRVLISPYAVEQPPCTIKTIELALTREQIVGSPGADAHEPVSRQYEQTLVDYYGHPAWWEGGGLWAAGGYPRLPLPAEAVEFDASRKDIRALPAQQAGLRSAERVNGYAIQCIDGSVGHVCDYLFDDESWAIRYLVVETRHWWPGGPQVLIGTHWLEQVDWPEKAVRVLITREQVLASPIYDAKSPVHRDYEHRLHEAYDRTGYWG